MSHYRLSTHDSRLPDENKVLEVHRPVGSSLLFEYVEHETVKLAGAKTGEGVMQSPSRAVLKDRDVVEILTEKMASEVLDDKGRLVGEMTVAVPEDHHRDTELLDYVEEEEE